MNCWVTGQCAAELIGSRGLFDGSLIEVESNTVYSSQTKRNTNSLLLMKSRSRSTVFIGNSIWPRSVDVSKELCKYML